MVRRKLLDVADNLERALESAKEGGAGGASLDNLVEGVEMTSDQARIGGRREGRGVQKCCKTL